MKKYDLAAPFVRKIYPQHILVIIWTWVYLDYGLTGLYKKIRLGVHGKVVKIIMNPMIVSLNNR